MSKRIIASIIAILTISATVYAGNTPLPQVVNVPMNDRPMIAVVAFDDGAIHHETWWGRGWRVGSGLADILTTTMLDRGRFRMVERSRLDKVMGEQDLGASGRIDPQSAAKIGKLVGADYLIMGKVTQFSQERTGVGTVLGHLTGVGFSDTKAKVAVDLRVVDSTTGEIIGSWTGKGESDKGSVFFGSRGFGVIALGSSDFMSSILGNATKKAIVAWTDNLCGAMDTHKIDLQPKHAKPDFQDAVILDIEPDTIITNAGTLKGYRLGDVVQVRRKGKTVKDPETGEVIRVVSTLICTAKIVRIDEKSADIAYIGGAQPAVGDIITLGDQVQIPTSAPAAAPSGQYHVGE
jgi:curli biogenesis system outer membrane secretion channel CsgG